MKIEDYSKYYIQGSDHYLMPKDVFKELFNEMLNWKETVQKQKEIINKAIERIEKGIFILPTDIDEVLDILKEVSE